MAVQEEAIAESASGISGMIAEGLSEPMLSFVFQPGKYKYPDRHKTATGKVKMGKRKYVPNPKFPQGIRLSFPSWFVAVVGIAAVLYGIDFLDTVLGKGEKPKGKVATESEAAVIEGIVASSPVGAAYIIAKNLGWVD